MEFLLTNVSTEASQLVTRECVDRVKGKGTINMLIEKVKKEEKPVSVHFEGEYDLEISQQL